jgi:hypothetical protein
LALKQSKKSINFLNARALRALPLGRAVLHPFERKDSAVMSNDAQFLTRKKAGEYLRARYGVASHFMLAKLGRKGPRYCVVGRNSLYRRADLDQWMQERMQDPRAFARGRPHNLPTQKRAVGGAAAAQPIAEAQNHDAALAEAFAVLRGLGLQT